MKTIALAALLATLAGLIVAALAPAFAAETPAGRAYVRNPWGGVVSCDFRHNPTATATMAAYCAGASIPSADPARFDCRQAEVTSEFDFCGLPYPTRR